MSRKFFSIFVWVILFIVGISLAVALGTADAQQWVSRQHAPGASVYFDCEMYCLCSFIFVGEVLNLLDRSQSSASLSYSVIMDGTIWRGYLLIPLESFKKIGESGKATLYVDTSTLPYFYNQTCTLVDVDGNCLGTCVDGGPVGVIEINWTPNGEFRGEYKTFYRQFYSSDPMPRLYQESSTEFSAIATGVIFGRPISGEGTVNEPQVGSRLP